MNLQLEEKLVLVTGSTAGIGLAIASAFAAEGARVIINGRTKERVEKASARIRAAHPSAKVEGLPTDSSVSPGRMKSRRWSLTCAVRSHRQPTARHYAWTEASCARLFSC